MDLSIVIPTRNRLPALHRVMSALNAQKLPDGRFEVIVTVDGPADREQAALTDLTSGLRCTFVEGAPDGPAAARNRALPVVRAPLVLFLNDDVVPAPTLVAEHLSAHRTTVRPAMVLGSAPWAIAHPDRVLDRLVRESSIVFFFDQMAGPRACDPSRDWGFRHAWTLNLSLPTDALRAAGGFATSLRFPVYEDVEMAHRVIVATGMPVLFRPAAVVTHEHRYEVPHLTRREALLGHQAFHLARINPKCARDIFGFLHTDPNRIREARERVRFDMPRTSEALALFAASAGMSGDSLEPVEIAGIFEHLWKPARAQLRRVGWIAAADGESAQDAMAAAEALLPTLKVSHAA